MSTKNSKADREAMQAEHDRLVKEAEERKKNKKPDVRPVTKANRTKSSSALRYRRMDKVESKPINWLWPGRIACGKVTLIAGDPGLGKSQITASLAGIITTGGKWPVDGAKSPKGAVIFLSAEDVPPTP